MTPADDTLAAGAAMAWQLAPQLCEADAAGGSCAGMHGVWLCLRRLGLLGTIESRRDFYLKALADTTGTDGRPPRVLISGAADYAMLEFVLAAFQARGLVPEVTVTDVCETPLALNRWYAERAGCAIETVRGDILEFVPGAPYDIVCTDFFLGWIAPERRAALVAKWRSLLRPGGVALTANGLRPADDPAHAAARIEFSPAQIAQLRASVLERAVTPGAVLPAGPEALADLAADYAAWHRAYPVRSVEDVRGLFEGGGFELRRLAVENVAAGAPGVSGPTLRGATKQYFTLIAIRR
ncbi:MAG: class I SAM-dependent methyltransferase [Burkholderiales bacterium]